MSQNPPATLGKYQIIREIARSNDIVYEAYDPLMNRRVALKELAVPHGSTDQQRDDRIKRFLREAKAAGSLAHPNIVTIYEVGEEAGRHFIAMEYLDGHTLRNEIDTSGVLELSHAFDVARAVLRALEYAHQNGVIHRDIKPDNIQLLSDGRIKLTDFGIARLTFEPNLTMDGQVFGTPSYMSPEQVVGRDIDARSDLFSIGVVLYEMLGGQKPFHGDSVVAITYAIMNKEPDQPKGVNYQVWQVMNRALDKSPALRYANAAEFMKALDSAEHASKNPVLDPTPPPAQQTLMTNPYGAPGAGYHPGNVYTTPYGTPNPYQQQPQPTPPPIAYPFNPYSQSQPAQGQPTGMPMSPQTYQMPVQMYYPPPPRSPLLKPHQVILMRKVGCIAALLATFFVAVVVALTYFASAVQSSSVTPSGSPTVQPVTVQSPIENPETISIPVDVESVVSRARQAEANAETATSVQERIQYLRTAAESFESAANTVNDAQEKAVYGERAARCYQELGFQYEAVGDRIEARLSYRNGLRNAPEGTDIAITLQLSVDSLT